MLTVGDDGVEFGVLDRIMLIPVEERNTTGTNRLVSIPTVEANLPPYLAGVLNARNSPTAPSAMPKNDNKTKAIIGHRIKPILKTICKMKRSDVASSATMPMTSAMIASPLRFFSVEAKGVGGVCAGAKEEGGAAKPPGVEFAGLD